MIAFGNYQSHSTHLLYTLYNVIHIRWIYNKVKWFVIISLSSLRTWVFLSFLRFLFLPPSFYFFTSVIHISAFYVNAFLNFTLISSFFFTLSLLSLSFSLILYLPIISSFFLHFKFTFSAVFFYLAAFTLQFQQKMHSFQLKLY